MIVHPTPAVKDEQLSDNDCPTVDELRVSAKVMRYMANILDIQEKQWPLWKRAIMDYPARHHYENLSVKLDTIADKLIQHEESKP